MLKPKSFFLFLILKLIFFESAFSQDSSTWGVGDYFNPRSCFKDEGEYERKQNRRVLVYSLLSKITDFAGIQKCPSNTAFLTPIFSTSVKASVKTGTSSV